jgi:carbamoyltransferase
MTKAPQVLGISAYFHDSAAALVEEGQVLAAVQEERFTRRKSDPSFPENAIRYCLSQRLDPTRPLKVAFFENPVLKADRIVKNAMRIAPRGAPIWRRSMLTLDILQNELPRRLMKLAGGDPNLVYFSQHHRSHAASAFYPSGLNSAAVLVVDGVGEWATTSIWRGRGRTLDLVWQQDFPHSLGLFYSAFTQYCGFKVNSGEYKLMGLAPFGEAARFEKLIWDNLIRLDKNDGFTLDMAYFGFDSSMSSINPLFEDLFGQPARPPESALTPHFMDVAAAAQAVLQDVVLHLAQKALAETGEKNLCLAGGVALNCVSNSVIFKNLGDLADLWIQPAAGDAGCALGAALDVSTLLAPQDLGPSPKMKDAYLGPGYSDAQIETALVKSGVVYRRAKDRDALCQDAAQALSDGLVIGHFDGRSEFGPRALGNRSILADPRPADMLSRVNHKIKFREGWRPFAPIILAERAQDYFEPPTDSPFMLLTSDIRPEFRAAISKSDVRAGGVYTAAGLQGAMKSDFAAATHVDWSSRLQTIDLESPSRARKILEAFFQLSSCPMLLNTSFNIRGEPIVNHPDEAISCFLKTEMDVLYIGGFIVRKSEQLTAPRLYEED